MKRAEILTILVIAMALMVCPAQLAKAAPLGTAFTYQGRLIDANGVANGPYDFEFRLFDDPCTGAPLVGTIDINNLDVIEGYFTVELDFGDSVFAGDARWLGITVRPGDSTGSFDVLSPRQELTPTPYAIYAENAGTDNDWMVSGNHIYSIPSGNVGIGAMSPSSKLHVEDNTTGDLIVKIHNQNDAGTERLYFGTSTSTDAGIMVYGSSNPTYPGKWRFFNNKTSAHYDWITGGSVKMTLTNQGMLGIGFSNPTTRLWIEESGSDDPLRIRVAGSTKLIVKNDGKVGIGTLNPDEQLTVVGNVKIDGNLNIYNGATKIMELGAGLDYAEGFDVSAQGKIEPGSVLVIDPDNAGKLALSNKSYDTKVAGIVAGAKGLGSGVRLGAGQFDYDVALAGRVYCKVDATEEAVQPGDLLTTSATPGYAMKAANYVRAQGAILGKAMESLEKGQKGQILVLVTLQ